MSQKTLDTNLVPFYDAIYDLKNKYVLDIGNTYSYINHFLQ